VNLQLTEFVIQSVCRELIKRRGQVSGRALRQELKTRYGAVGKTQRIFAIWRTETEAAAARRQLVGAAHEELVARLEAAEGQAAENLARAQRAEEREESHQSHWAVEIDRLRGQLGHQPNYAAEVHRLQAQITELTGELSATRQALQRALELR
jgi:hypothetical protein